MERQNIIFMYEDGQPAPTLSGGNYQAGLPLANLITDDLKKIARTTNVTLASTQFRMTYAAAHSTRAVVVGPANLSATFKYRIRTYTSAAFSTVVVDTGWIQPPAAPATTDRCIVHVFQDVVSSRWWSVEIDDQANPAGYLDIGCLFMPLGYQPSINYEFGATFGLRNNSLTSSTLNGGKKIWRRVNPRVFRVALPPLPETEGFGAALTFLQTVGFDGRVFVISDPDDTATLPIRSFFGTISEMDPLTQALFGRVGVGFQIEEII